MKITRATNLVTHLFNIDIEGKEYSATVWTEHDSSKFIDWDIVDVHGDAVDKELDAQIISQIDKEWEKL